MSIDAQHDVVATLKRGDDGWHFELVNAAGAVIAVSFNPFETKTEALAVINVLARRPLRVHIDYN